MTQGQNAECTALLCILGMLASSCKDDCSEMSVTECDNNNGCTTIHASPIDVPRACLGPGESVGCVDAERPCDDALSYARRADGTIFQFSSSCQPAGWKSLGGDIRAVTELESLPPVCMEP